MVLFTPQGQEVTRLPGEVEPVRYTEVLTLGMNAARPVSAVLADALAKPASLTRQRLAPARLLFVGHRPPAGDRQGSPAGDPARARRRRSEGRARRRDAVAPEGARRRRCQASRSAVDAATRGRRHRPPRRRGAHARADRHGDQLRRRDRPGDEREGLGRSDSARRRLRCRAEAARGRHGALARRSHAGADRAGRPGAHRRRRSRRRQAGREAGGAGRLAGRAARRRARADRRAPTARSPTATSARR